MTMVLIGWRSTDVVAGEREIPLSGGVKKQIDAITASFGDMGGLYDLDKHNSLIGEARLYSTPSLHSLAVVQKNIPPLHGMPGLVYQAIESINDKNAWGIVLSAGYASLHGLVMDDFTYRQTTLAANLLMGHHFDNVALFGSIGYQEARGDVNGSFLVDDETSHIAFTSAVPNIRLITRFKDYPLQCEWMHLAPHTETKLQLGEQGSHFYSIDATGWGVGSSQLGFLVPIGNGVVGVGYIHDVAHADFYRLSFAADLLDF